MAPLLSLEPGVEVSLLLHLFTLCPIPAASSFARSFMFLNLYRHVSLCSFLTQALVVSLLENFTILPAGLSTFRFFFSK